MQLLALMKKHSKTGVESRFQGTVLGVPAEPRTIKIEGGGPDSIEEWCQSTREKAIKVDAARKEETPEISFDVEDREPSVDIVMAD